MPSEEPATVVGDWRLRNRVEVSAGKVAYDVLGSGPPVVLVHGTPSRSLIWRNVVPTLAEHFSVYILDLLGFGDSERDEALDVSIAAQARMLKEVIGAWRLDDPAVAGHDIGGGIVLRAHILEGVRFHRIALLDAVVLRPWITPTTRHVKAHLDAYRTMPTYVFGEIVASHLRTATRNPMEAEAFDAYMDQWRGPEGQKLYLHKDEYLDEEHTAEFEPMLGSVEVPVRILWGEHDAWLDPTLGERLREKLPAATFEKVPEAGHFVTEDAPGAVAFELDRFFRG